MTNFTAVTLAQRPDLIDPVCEVNESGWPEFMFHDPVADRLFHYLYDVFLDFQVALLDDSGSVIAAGNSIPVTWDGRVESLPDRGWDAMMELGVSNYEKGVAPDTLSAIQVVIAREHLGSGLSKHVLMALKAGAARHGFKAMIAPVRPNLKHQYPLTPMERYIRWTQPDGAPFDPWLRTHWKLGAQMVGVCSQSMINLGTADEWESWIGMRFPETGAYVVPGALCPVEIDREQNAGRYVEPNVWMLHKIAVANNQD